MNFSIFAVISVTESISGSWSQVVLVTAVSFAIITLGISFFRFRAILDKITGADSANIEDSAVYFQAIVATSFGSIRERKDVVAGVLKSPVASLEDLFDFLKKNVRAKVDSVVLLEDAVGVVISGDKESFETTFSRWSSKFDAPIFCGAAVYPDFSQTSLELISGATKALNEFDQENGLINWAESESDESDENSEKDSENSEDEEEEEEESYSSSLDPLTGVLSMTNVAGYMRKFIGEYRRKHKLALFEVGLSGLDDIVDLYGNDAADAVRKAVSEEIQASLRIEDVIGRYDEDEFLVLLICDEEYVADIAKRLRDRVAGLVVLHKNRRLKVTVNVGASMCPKHGKSLAQVFSAADKAYKTAKSRNSSMALVAGDE